MWMGWTSFILAALLSVGMVPAQSAAQSVAQSATQSDGIEKLGRMPSNADPDWEVVTVKPSAPDEQLQDVRTLGRHMLIHQQTVEAMLRMGYGLENSQIANAPEWVKTEYFDADGLADVEGEPSLPQFQSLLRKLLAERFGLKAHKEQRVMAVFALTVAKGGPKLTPTKGERFSGGQQNAKGGEGSRTLAFRDTPMQDFVAMMLDYLDRPVVDQTGLKGSYDFTLKYTYDETRAPNDGTAPPDLFTAIQEQLGLKLAAVKAPAEVLVIDQVERPGAN
jgi:uncharacterized protein (TIGR03435 family)